jgi:hypothetical protein
VIKKAIEYFVWKAAVVNESKKQNILIKARTSRK